MPAKRLEERFAYTGGKVDRTGPRPVIRDVLLCGPTSANRRRYRTEAFAGDRVKKYDGRPVFLNHSVGNAPRQYESRIAKVINPRLRADGMPVGDLEVRPKHPYAEAFLDDAEHDPRSVGMSHVAHCDTARGADGWDEVTAIERVESVDVVLDPATTKGLHESTRVKISLKQFVERFGAKWGPQKWARATKLCEDLGDMGSAPVMDAPPDDVADGDLKSALMAALTPMMDEAFESGNSDKLCSAVRDFVKLHQKHTGGTAAAGDGEDEPAEPKGEGKTAKLGIAGLVAEAKALGLDPTGEQLAAMSEVGTVAGRATLIGAFKKAAEGQGAERPKSTGRAGTTTVAKPTQEAVIPTDGKSFKARYSE